MKVDEISNLNSIPIEDCAQEVNLSILLEGKISKHKNFLLSLIGVVPSVIHRYRP
jgi:hypothetical protein